jgi:hypothetical protein
MLVEGFDVCARAYTNQTVTGLSTCTAPLKSKMNIRTAFTVEQVCTEIADFVRSFVRSFVRPFIHSFIHSFIHVSQSVSQSFVVCLVICPQPFAKRVAHKVRPSHSSFKFQYLLFYKVIQ